jgi:hypothetical protein
MEQDLKKHRVLVTPTTFGSCDKRLCQELKAAVGEAIPGETPLHPLLAWGAKA